MRILVDTFRNIRSFIKHAVSWDTFPLKTQLNTIDIVVFKKDEKFVLYMDIDTDRKRRYFYNLRSNTRYQDSFEFVRIQDTTEYRSVYNQYTTTKHSDINQHLEECPPTTTVKTIKKLVDELTVSRVGTLREFRATRVNLNLKDIRCHVKATEHFMEVYMDLSKKEHIRYYDRVRMNRNYAMYCKFYILNYEDPDLIEHIPIETYFSEA